jgi:hypothetical protein
MGYNEVADVQTRIMITGERYQFLSNTPDEIISEADSFWATPCSAYHVQYEPDQATIRKITELQDQIEATDAREFYRMPAHSLHMTVLTLFPATANVATQDNTPWSQHNETWFERTRDICASTRPFRVEFDAIRTTSRAIVLIGNESEDLKHFRQKIVTAVSLPVWKFRPHARKKTKQQLQPPGSPLGHLRMAPTATRVHRFQGHRN